MATYIHKHGSDTGTILLADYELGISDAAYGYTAIGGTVQKIKAGYADNANTLDGIDSGSFFRKDGQDQSVSDTNVTFANKVTATEFVGNLTGTASSAKYADLAENYEADKEYDYGTVLFLGKETEVDCNGGQYFGVVSQKPGYLLNSEPDFKKYVPIALKGRVPVKLSKKSEKPKRGDKIIVDRNDLGKAKVGTNINPYDFIGICLNPIDDEYCEVFIK